MLYSKVARLSDAHATRTNRTARTSSTVSITTIGAEESIRTFQRVEWIRQWFDQSQVAAVE